MLYSDRTVFRLVVCNLHFATSPDYPDVTWRSLSRRTAVWIEERRHFTLTFDEKQSVLGIYFEFCTNWICSLCTWADSLFDQTRDEKDMSL